MFAPIFMVRIQVILLFITMEQINSEKRKKILEIVQYEYCKAFSVDETSVKTILCDGKSSMSEKFEIVLDISSTEKKLNAGNIQDAFRKNVSEQLYRIFPKWMGFTGRISIRNDKPLELPNNPDLLKDEDDDKDSERYKNYIAEDAEVDFERLQLPQSTLEEIDISIKRIELEDKVFEQWGLYAIMPNPICALNFYGAPGTGKTMAADAIAKQIKRKIIHASYADIESKYHGEGPKNVQAIFKAAQEQNAVLFIDEADSLLSKRLTNVTQGSEQAINSMRSQILICLEKFHGVVIFASNLVVNYDRAFASRLTSIHFKLPDAEMREKIWKAHLFPTPNAKVQLKIPLADDIDIKALAQNYEVCGREIRNAVVNACVNACVKDRSELSQEFLVEAIEKEIQRREELSLAKDNTNLSAINGINKIVEDKVANASEN